MRKRLPFFSTQKSRYRRKRKEFPDVRILGYIHLSLEGILEAGVRFPPCEDFVQAVILEVDRGLLKSEMTECFKALTAREQRILRLRFGFEDGWRRTLKQVAEEFGLTPERIRAIEARALRKLRKPELARKLRPFL